MNVKNSQKLHESLSNPHNGNFNPFENYTARHSLTT